MNRKLIKRDLLIIFNIEMIFLTICMSILLSTYVGLRLRSETLNIVDYFIVLFAGPSVNETILLNFFVWFFPVIIFMYGLLNFLYCEWEIHYKYTVLRCGSIIKWIWYKICTFSMYSFVYLIVFYIIAFIIAIILGYNFFEESNLNFLYNTLLENNIYILHLLNILLVLVSLILISVISLLLSFIFKKSIYSYLIISLIYSIPYFSEKLNLKVLNLLPSERSIFARHSLLDYNLSMHIVESYIYSIILGIVIIWGLNILMKKFDLN